MKHTKILALIAILTSSSTMAENEFSNLDKKNVYAGGGLVHTTMDGVNDASGIGLQGFVGYKLDDLVELNDQLTLSVELGYTTTTLDYDVDFGFGNTNYEFDIAGLWSTAVIGYQFEEKMKVIGRAGIDLGDDDGLMFGGGVEYAVDSKIAIRAEYVIRSNTNSLQLNATYQF